MCLVSVSKPRVDPTEQWRLAAFQVLASACPSAPSHHKLAQDHDLATSLLDDYALHDTSVIVLLYLNRMNVHHQMSLVRAVPAHQLYTSLFFSKMHNGCDAGVEGAKRWLLGNANVAFERDSVILQRVLC